MNRKRSRAPQTFWLAAILICLAAVIFALAYSSIRTGTPPAASPAIISPGVSPIVSPVISQEISPVISPEASPIASPIASPGASTAPVSPSSPDVSADIILAQTDDMGQDYLEKIYYMGDSTTNGLAYYRVVDPNRVWTPKNATFALFAQSTIKILDRTLNKELSIEELFDEYKPEYLIITLGVNGVDVLSDERFIANYVNLIERIGTASPDTKIIVNSIYPCTKNTTTGVKMDEINHGNELCLQIAEQTGVRYLDSSAALKGEDGYLVETYTNGDGLHLSPAAFGKVLDYIKTHGYK